MRHLNVRTPSHFTPKLYLHTCFLHICYLHNLASHFPFTLYLGMAVAKLGRAPLRDDARVDLFLAVADFPVIKFPALLDELLDEASSSACPSVSPS